MTQSRCVVASREVVPPEPWQVFSSSKFPGHCYFYNAVTKESSWSLDIDVLTGKQGCIEEEVAFGFPTLPPANHVSKGGTVVDSGDTRVAESTYAPPMYDRAVASLSSRAFSLPRLESLKKMVSSPKSIGVSAPRRYRVNSRQSTRVVSRASSVASVDMEDTKEEPRFSLRDGRPPVEVVAGLGSGGFANVVLVTPTTSTGSFDSSGKAPAGTKQGNHAPNDNRRLYAMKVVSKMDHQRFKDQERLKAELCVMRDLPPSRFLERCHAAFESVTHIFFVCDHLAGGDLFDVMNQRLDDSSGGFSEAETQTLLAEITLGVVHLHSNGYIHRDLKLENVMLDASGHVKLIDFGLAAKIVRDRPEQPLSPTGSLGYMSPELVRNGRKTGGRHTDWWAVGVLAYEFMTGNTPWVNDRNRFKMKHEIENCQVVRPRHVSPEAGCFVEGLLEIDFRRRLGTRQDADVKNAPFFRGLDWRAVERGENPPAFNLSGGDAGRGKAAERSAEGKTALQEYLEKKSEDQQPRSGVTERRFGVSSPWFLGVDVVVSHPACPGCLP